MNSLLDLSVGLDKLPDNHIPVMVRLPTSENVEVLLQLSVTETDVAIMFESESGYIRTLYAPLTNVHRIWRHKIEICDKNDDVILVLESNSYDFYKLILGE